MRRRPRYLVDVRPRPIRGGPPIPSRSAVYTATVLYLLLVLAVLGYLVWNVANRG